MLHAHPTFATALACLGRPIPAFHFMVAVAGSLSGVLARAIEVETLARQYFHVIQIGEPVILDDAEIDVVLEKFSTYIHGMDDSGGE